MAGLVVLAAVLAAYSVPASAAGSTASVSLFDDDGNVALFDPAALAPGVPRTSCISVGAQHAVPGDSVRVAVTDVSGALAPYLTVTVETGSGASFGSCVGFTGGLTWTGSLAALAAASVGDGVPTGWEPSVHPSRSFRVTALLADDPAAAGLTARGRFAWRLVPGPAAPPTPTPTPTVPPTRPTVAPTVDPGSGTASPSPPASGAPTPTRTGTGDPDGTVDPGSEPPGPDDPDPGATPAGPGTVTGPPPAAPPATGGLVRPGGPDAVTDLGAAPGPGAGEQATPTPDLVIGAVRIAVVRETVRRVAETALTLARQPQYPLSAMGLAGLFLLVQDLIDRRDPKLAVARVTQRDDRVPFPDLFPPGGGRR